MPEYLTPGVYLEETSYRSRSIEGVATSTFGMAGVTRYGPVPYRLELGANRPLAMVPDPTLVTSFTEFERTFGDANPVTPDSSNPNYLALAARAFFDNGGRRLYVSRVFGFTEDANGAIDITKNFAARPVGAGAPPVATWRTRWPGDAGTEMQVKVDFVRSKNIQSGTKLMGVNPGAAIEVMASPTTPDPPRQADGTATPPASILTVALDAQNNQVLKKPDGTTQAIAAGAGARHITLTVTVTWGERIDVYPGLELSDPNPRAIANVLQAADPADEASLLWLDVVTPVADANALFLALIDKANAGYLTAAQAISGSALSAALLKGEPADPDDVTKAATGLAALLDVEDVAIVACPDTVRLQDAEQKTAVDYLIAHCETPKAYRIGIVDPPSESSISEVRHFRGQFDTKYAALYYPWVRVVDPNAKPDPSSPPATLDLPPSGYAAGIYARSDIERGVHKAPANEVVLGITQFVENVTYDRQSVLNPEGINALRFFPGRANRVWGARTLSSDPEWKYVNVRRLFNFLEHSIDRATQWAVFEPNNERLWASITQSVEDFLITVWRTGALMGTKPEEAFFVRCDRTTMTQNDLDNGRMICLIGVAPTYPAEFVIFRIGQWTADSRQS